jgi:alpha-L-rhamnosidase
MKTYFQYLCVIFITATMITACNKDTYESDKQSQASHLLVEGLVEPLNVHSQTPRLSWHANVITQSAYQIQVATKSAYLDSDNPDLWDSGKVAERRSINIPYNGKTLTAGDEIFWRVRVWQSEQTNPNQWSEVGEWEMGLVTPDDWQADWIQVERPVIADTSSALMDWVLFAANVHKDSNFFLRPAKVETQNRVVEQLKVQPTASLFRHSFAIPADKTITKARLHSTAAGYYEIFLNGKKVDDRLMDPGQTDYDQRILYNTDPVSNLLLQGNNTIAVHLGSGWYDEDIAFSKWNNPDKHPSTKPSKSLSYGQPKFITQLVITYQDGSEQLVNSNADWVSHPSPVLKEGLFSGELFDARKEVSDWNVNRVMNNEDNWQPVQALEQWPTKRLEPQLLPPITKVKKLTPVAIFAPKKDVWVLDFGQNFTGVPTLDLKQLALQPGQSIHLRYAEWVDKAGNISQKSGGGAPLLKQVDTYIAAGNDERWTPTFTWHGFRYIEVRGLQQAPPLNAFTAHLLRSNVETVGQFKSSDVLVNKIHQVALWGYESNLMAVPMDCPIRERAGWTGDAHAAMITGNYNFKMDNFWDKYLGDFETAQFVAPAVVPGKRTHGGNYDWAAAEIMIAWENYRHHGDLQLLARQYDSMVEYMDSGESKLENSLLRIGYGDWCDPVVSPGVPRVNGRCSPQHTTPTVTSSALFAHSANLMSKISQELNKVDEASYYQRLFNQISQQFNQELLDADTGDYKSQTGNSMALMFEIAPEHLRPSIAKALNHDVVNKWNGHASVGALGQTYLYRALSDHGYGDTAFNIFKAQGYPGYAYLFDELDATTLWERKGFYDPKQDPDGTKGQGFSLNHPFHSGYDGWFYEGLGGIRPLADSVGYQDFELAPQFVNGLNSVDVSYTTGYGSIESRWQREGGSITWEFVVPNNSTAMVRLPNQSDKLYLAGSYSLTIAQPSH